MTKPSKSQQKKARRREYKKLRELADLYRKQAQASLELANRCDFEAEKYNDRPPFKPSRMPKRVLLWLDGTPRVMLEINELHSLYPELYEEVKRQVDARPNSQ